MKANIIAILALSALTLSPALGAPRKMAAAKSEKETVAAEEPAEDRVPRKQAEARELVAELTTAQKSRMLTLLNEGSPEDLAAIKGISTTRAGALEEARPFEAIDEAVLVRGIGAATMTEIVAHARSLTTTSPKKSAATSSSKVKKSS